MNINKYNIKYIKDNYHIYVNINWDIIDIIIPNNFDFETIWYEIMDKSSYEDNLIRWISESRNESDKSLMEQDLDTLIRNKSDNYILVSTETNNLLFKDDEEFNKIIEKIITSNKVAQINKNNKNYQQIIDTIYIK